MTALDSVFKGNQNELLGGSAAYTDGGTIELIRSVVEDNGSLTTGTTRGTVSARLGTIKVYSSTFRRNQAWVTAAIDLSGSSLTAHNSVFENNVSELGPATINARPLGALESLATVVSSTFNNNNILGGNAPRDISVGGAGTADVDNSVFWNTVAWRGTGFTGTAVVTVRSSNVIGSNGSGPGWSPFAGVDGDSNIDADPVFVDAAAGRLHHYRRRARCRRRDAPSFR